MRRVDLEEPPELEDSMRERRKTRRFKVSWPVSAKEAGLPENGVCETCTLENISSGGGFLLMGSAPVVGRELNVCVRVPSNQANWLRYSALVVRTENIGTMVGVGIRFKTAKPEFMRTDQL